MLIDIDDEIMLNINDDDGDYEPPIQKPVLKRVDREKQLSLARPGPNQRLRNETLSNAIQETPRIISSTKQIVTTANIPKKGERTIVKQPVKLEPSKQEVTSSTALKLQTLQQPPMSKIVSPIKNLQVSQNKIGNQRKILPSEQQIITSNKSNANDLDITSDSLLKNKRKIYTPEEDPMQFHANPSELSKGALSLKQPRHQKSSSTNSNSKNNLIFSRTSFSDLPLHPRLVSLLEKSSIDGGFGLLTSTRIQSVVVPLLANKPQNVLMKSQTGSGKTLAYLIPILNDLMSDINQKVTRNDGTRALVIAPTRELCSQIADVLMKLTQCCVWIVSGSVTGGERKKSEKSRLRKGVVVLVGEIFIIVVSYK